MNLIYIQFNRFIKLFIHSSIFCSFIRLLVINLCLYTVIVETLWAAYLLMILLSFTQSVGARFSI